MTIIYTAYSQTGYIEWSHEVPVDKFSTTNDPDDALASFLAAITHMDRW